MEFIAIWLIFGAVSAIIANSKGLSVVLYLILGILLGPIGLIIAIAAGSGNKCPACKKSVHKDAIKCPYCQTDIKQAKETELNLLNGTPDQIINSNLEKYKKIRALADLRDKKVISQEQFNEYQTKC